MFRTVAKVIMNLQLRIYAALKFNSNIISKQLSFDYIIQFIEIKNKTNNKNYNNSELLKAHISSKQ